MAKFNIGAVLSLKDNMSATLRGVREELTEFRKDIEDTRKRLERTYKRKYTMKLNQTAAMKKIKEIRESLEPLRKKVVTTIATKDMITRNIRKTHNKLKGFARKTFAPIVTIKDKTMGFFKGVTKRFFNLKTLAATVLGGIGLGKMLESGAELEKQTISMKHFIGFQRADASQDEVNKLTKDYIAELRKSAAETPFDTPEVIQAGTRAINVAKGNTEQAMDLVRIAEDMAALNPKKSLEDAMEALAGMQVGNLRRMKEFGFNITAEDVKNAGGVANIIQNQIKPFFAGGAEKLSKSGAGLWSTLKGLASTKIQDTGLNILEQLVPHLERAVDKFEELEPFIDSVSEKFGSGIGWVLDRFGDLWNWIETHSPEIQEIIGNVTDWISEKFGWIGEKTQWLKGVASEAWPGIQGVIQTAGHIIRPILDIIADGAKIVADVFELAWPSIKGIVSNVWDFVRPILEKLGDALGWVADKAGKIAGWLDKKVSNRNTKSKRVDGSHASGLSYVPRDGYIAELHRGEAVLNQKEAEIYRKTVNQPDTPKAPDATQTIKQRFEKAKTPRIPDTTQTIKQKLSPIDIPKISNIVQSVKQKLDPIRVPSIKDQVQTIKQKLSPARISELPSINQVADLPQKNQITDNSKSATTTNKTENNPRIEININAKDRTPEQVVNEIVPQLKLALANM